MFRIPLSLPTLVGIILSVILFKSEASSGVLTCTSPCQQADATGAPGISLPPCVISTTSSCETDGTVPVNQAPGPPLQVGLDSYSSSYIATDGKIYLDLVPRWKASTDRINYLTGYEVKVMCHQSICATQYFCVTILFNRTLTVSDAQSNFSVTCQYGDFAQPDMDYITIIRSLPNNDDNSNEGRFLTKLPSCGQESNLTVCNIESPDNWRPYSRPTLTQIANGSVQVTFWPSDKYTVYEVLLQKQEGNYEHYQVTYRFNPMLNLENAPPIVLFNNVQEGTYRAHVWISETQCDGCIPLWIDSDNEIAVKAMPTPASSTTHPSSLTTPSDTTTSPTATPTPSSHLRTSVTPEASLPLATLSGALGGVLGLLLMVLILFFIFRSYMRSRAHSPGPPKETRHGGDPTQSSMSHHKNIPYNDCDSLNGTQYINHFTLSNGTTIYSDDPTCRFTNPSMVPATIHHDNMINGRLNLQESQFYADSMPYKEMDSISKVVDIHSPVDVQTSSKCEQPSSPDSGLESLYSDGTMEDGRTLFSLALTSLGDEV
ncbi:uncharacterized protein LOC100893345 [Strongylocentrotus purpuratus]|uniref:Fibronectin type-III domain-containing protein n=1 Tax=Strongylocentrotus purpuratus TaxID=7668 RepID=A0A7M7MZG6_STRPU|nr:uncharacterized protein LOC100893345 [Strongylocentrotus purpuratus]